MSGSAIIQRYKSYPEFKRMVLTALIGVFIGLITYKIIYSVNPLLPKATSSWFISFVIGVVRQHGLHRWLTFEEKSPYWQSLFKAFILYSSALIITTLLNWFLVEDLQLHHLFAWLLCISINAFVSLLFLKRFVFQSVAHRR